MLEPEAFARMRLSDFLPPQDITTLSDWEYLERLWVGEANGFSEWLRPETEPDTLAALSLDLTNFPQPALELVLRRLELPLRPGMEPPEVEPILGPALSQQRFVSDRITYHYAINNNYRAECTFLEQGGLTYFNLTLR